MGKIPSCKSLSTLGDRSFYMAAPKLWKDLLLFMRNISSAREDRGDREGIPYTHPSP